MWTWLFALGRYILTLKRVERYLEILRKVQNFDLSLKEIKRVGKDLIQRNIVDELTTFFSWDNIWQNLMEYVPDVSSVGDYFSQFQEKLKFVNANFKKTNIISTYISWMQFIPNVASYKKNVLNNKNDNEYKKMWNDDNVNVVFEKRVDGLKNLKNYSFSSWTKQKGIELGDSLTKNNVKGVFGSVLLKHMPDVGKTFTYIKNIKFSIYVAWINTTSKGTFSVTKIEPNFFTKTGADATALWKIHEAKWQKFNKTFKRTLKTGQEGGKVFDDVKKKKTPKE